MLREEPSGLAARLFLYFLCYMGVNQLDAGDLEAYFSNVLTTYTRESNKW